jgi:hypothetical protein
VGGLENWKSYGLGQIKVVDELKQNSRASSAVPFLLKKDAGAGGGLNARVENEEKIREWVGADGK